MKQWSKPSNIPILSLPQSLTSIATITISNHRHHRRRRRPSPVFVLHHHRCFCCYLVPNILWRRQIYTAVALLDFRSSQIWSSYLTCDDDDTNDGRLRSTTLSSSSFYFGRWWWRGRWWQWFVVVRSVTWMVAGGEVRFKAKGEKVERIRENGSGDGDRGRWWLWLEWDKGRKKKEKEMRELKPWRKKDGRDKRNCQKAEFVCVWDPHYHMLHLCVGGLRGVCHLWMSMYQHYFIFLLPCLLWHLNDSKTHIYPDYVLCKSCCLRLLNFLHCDFQIR